MYNVYGKELTDFVERKLFILLLLFSISSFNFSGFIQDDREEATEEEQLQDIYLMYIERDIRDHLRIQRASMRFCLPPSLNLTTSSVI